MALYRIDDQSPQVDPSAFVAESADVIGSVTLGPHSSVWSQASLRGDNAPITVGARSNIQESAVLHTDIGMPLVIGSDVTVGHQAMLHGCTVGDGALIGIQAVVLNGAVIGARCLVAAGALVTEGKTFEAGMLIMGSPARAMRALTPEELIRLELGVQIYVDKAGTFKQSLVRIDQPQPQPKP